MDKKERILIKKIVLLKELLKEMHIELYAQTFNEASENDLKIITEKAWGNYYKKHNL